MGDIVHRRSGQAGWRTLPILRPDVSSAPRAVADIGSNSARLLVVRPTDQGHLDVLADARVALRLMRDVDANGRLSRAALNRTVHTLAAFATIARRHGARAPSASWRPRPSATLPTETASWPRRSAAPG